MDNTKQNELDLFKKWKSTGEKKHFQDLYNSMRPLIHKAAGKAAMGSNLPESAHRIFAAQAFYDALRTFNPSAGAALQTHVYGSVENKVKRLNYQYQNLGSMPETRSPKVGLFQTERENLRNELGREPTSQELAQRTSIPVRDIERMQKELVKDLAMASGTEEMAFFEGRKEEEALHHLYYDLNQEERIVYEYIMGSYGKPKMVKSNGRVDFDGIAKKMSVSASKVRGIHTNIRKKYEKVI